MNIIPKLQLNFHPKDVDNLSLVSARNIKITNDGSCISNEESIITNDVINNYLVEYYNDGNVVHNYKILYVISCSKELVLFVNKNDSIKVSIFRYREKDLNHDEEIKCVYGNKDRDLLEYHGGKFIGTATYNSENQLIVIISEYDCDVKVPIKSINLGSFDGDEYNDLNLNDDSFTISPKINIPFMYNLNYKKGNAYKGIYHVFIRFKLNNVDYTQWYNFGQPIYVDTLEEQVIIKYSYNRKNQFKGDINNIYQGLFIPNKSPNSGYVTGCSDYFSNTSDIAKETFKFNIDLKHNNYNTIQLGFICSRKDYTKGFATYDIITNNNDIEYVFNMNNVREYSIKDFIIDYYNYYNVKSLTNYNNRIYIGNYKEDSVNDKIDLNCIDDINVELVSNRELTLNDVLYIATIGSYDNDTVQKNNNPNLYTSKNKSRIYFYEYFKCNKDELFNVKINNRSNYTDTADMLFFVPLHQTNSENNNLIINTSIGYLGIAKHINRETSDDNIKILTVQKDNKVSINSTRTDMNYIVKEKGIQFGAIHIDSNNSFDKRKLNTTLIPGEVYNFFIHFVDKYGHCTNGYRINNKNSWQFNNENGYIPVKFYSKTKGKNVYVPIKLTDNVCNNGVLNIPNYIKFYTAIDSNSFKNEIVDDNLINEFKEEYNSFNSDKYNDTKWYQIASPINYITPYINNNGDVLYKMPYIEDTQRIDINFDNTVNIDTRMTQLYIPKFSNIVIPKEYVAYFISYEKYEPCSRYTGILVKNDFRSQDYVHDVIRINSNTQIQNNISFYTSDLDTEDKINLDYNVIRIENKNCFKKEDIPSYDYMQVGLWYPYVYDINKPEIETNYVLKNVGIESVKLSVADDIGNNRAGLGTCIKIKDIYDLFKVYNTSAQNHSHINQYKVSLVNYTKDLYMSNTKTLIRISNIENGNTVICNQLHGVITYDGTLVYENSGYNHTIEDNIVRRFSENTKYYASDVSDASPHVWQNDIPFAAYFQYLCYDTKFYESKSYKDKPDNIVFYTKFDGDGKKTNEKNKFWAGRLVSPSDSTKLFEYKFDNIDNSYSKTYSNYRSDLPSITDNTKTIRRSNIIKDEDRTNNWRKFNIEEYKIITENKGDITNIIGSGNILLVHTQHSLFAFDVNNVLKTDDKNVQLNTPDVFDIAYKEIFTSALGYGGLQDNQSYIFGNFGYVYYDNDSNTFYRYDANKLNIINKDIVQWLNRIKPYNVVFGNDNTNNRLLIKMNYNADNKINEVIMSYNYATNSFVSLHDYHFDYVYNTKNKIYMIDNSSGRSIINNFVDDNTSYGKNIYVRDSSKFINTNAAKIGIMVNTNYDIIKYINAISYKLTKYKNNGNIIDYDKLPVEGTIEPFSSDYIRIYNNIVDTGYIDTLIDKEESKNIFANYDKPYWELGNWNLNYLRNNISNRTKYGDAFTMTRLFGNYFVIEFVFNNNDECRVELEEISYNINK